MGRLKTVALLGGSHMAATVSNQFAIEDTRLRLENEDMQARVKLGEFVCENHPDKLWPTECDCGAGMPRPGTTYGEKLPEQRQVIDIDVADIPEAQPEPPKPEGMPDGTPSWRENVARLAPAVAVSPLPTRQLKRMAAKALAKSLSSVAKIQERKERILQKKRDRADAAAARHKRIAEHDPSKPAD